MAVARGQTLVLPGCAPSGTVAASQRHRQRPARSADHGSVGRPARTRSGVVARARHPGSGGRPGLGAELSRLAGVRQWTLLEAPQRQALLTAPAQDWADVLPGGAVLPCLEDWLLRSLFGVAALREWLQSQLRNLTYTIRLRWRSPLLAPFGPAWRGARARRSMVDPSNPMGSVRVSGTRASPRQGLAR